MFLSISDTLPYWKTEDLSVKVHKYKRKIPQIDFRILNTEMKIHDATIRFL